MSQHSLAGYLPILAGLDDGKSTGASNEYSRNFYAVRWVCDLLYESTQDDVYRDTGVTNKFPAVTAATIVDSTHHTRPLATFAA